MPFLLVVTAMSIRFRAFFSHLAMSRQVVLIR